jgi:uracil-DNA glycosylase
MSIAAGATVWRSIAANALRTTRSTVAASQHTIRVRHSIQIRDARTEQGIRPTSAATGYIKSADRARSSSSLHSMSFVQTSDPNCFGEGPKRAAMMVVGEQPGDYEDVAGKPFVGPAGKIMDRALEDTGIDRSQVYVTNVVKHFKWEPRGKRRIHQKPNSREIAACRPWLETELRIVKPNLVVAMGATAAQAIFGPGFRVTRERGKVLSSKLAPRVLATVHPSSLLRQPDEESREREYKHFVLDLRAAVRAAGEE